MANGGRPIRAAKRYKKETLFIRTLTAEAEGLVQRAKTDEVKEECRKVYEALRYSDPMDSKELADVNNKLSEKIFELSKAVDGKPLDEVRKLTEEVVLLVGERERKCKLLK